MSIQMNLVSLENTEPPTKMKNESEIVETSIDDILDSSESEEKIIPDLKDIDIIYHPLCKESIKSETIPENILENKHSGSVETQVFVKTENIPFVKIENITESENSNKTGNTDNRNINESTTRGVVEVQGLNENFNTLDNLETNEQLILNYSSDLNGIRKAKHSKKTDIAECYNTLKTTSRKEYKEKIKVIKVPVIPIEPHEYTSLAKDKHVCNHCQHAYKGLRGLKYHIRKMHREVTTMYECPYCPYKSKWSIKKHIILKHKGRKDIQWFQCHLCERRFKLKAQITRHMKVHLTHEPMQDGKKVEFCSVCGKGYTRKSSVNFHMRFVHNKEKQKCQECEYTTTERQLLEHHIKSTHKNYKKRYNCDKCDYKTDKCSNWKNHKLIHLKPEETQYFYCYHCSYKANQKEYLKKHIFRHFKNGDVPFHCYICNYIMPKREAIVEHLKKHSKVEIKSKINE